MPMHDWSRVEANLYAHFRQMWVVHLSNALNGGLLPAGYSALLERPEVADDFGRRADRLTVRHRLARPVCVIEIVSPGNKSSRNALRRFLDSTLQFARAGANLVLVDPFPPTPRDPHSLHQLLWEEWTGEPGSDLPANKPIVTAAYRAGDTLGDRPPEAYLDSTGIGESLSDMPAFLDDDGYVMLPLERAYQAAWETCPADYRYLVEHGRLPDEDAE